MAEKRQNSSEGNGDGQNSKHPSTSTSEEGQQDERQRQHTPEQREFLQLLESIDTLRPELEAAMKWRAATMKEEPRQEIVNLANSASAVYAQLTHSGNSSPQSPPQIDPATAPMDTDWLTRAYKLLSQPNPSTANVSLEGTKQDRP